MPCELAERARESHGRRSPGLSRSAVARVSELHRMSSEDSWQLRGSKSAQMKPILAIFAVLPLLAQQPAAAPAPPAPGAEQETPTTPTPAATPAPAAAPATTGDTAS